MKYLPVEQYKSVDPSTIAMSAEADRGPSTNSTNPLDTLDCK